MAAMVSRRGDWVMMGILMAQTIMPPMGRHNRSFSQAGLAYLPLALLALAGLAGVVLTVLSSRSILRVMYHC